MKKLMFFNASIILLCTACSPLQQAPLVYSSKIAVGIDISGTSTESPGASLTIGYKQVDAAYVPVAVAKPCDEKTSGTDCTNPIYDLRVVSGKSNTQGSKHSGPSEDEAKKAIQDYELALKNLTNAKNSRDVLSLGIADLNKRKSSLEAKTEASKKLTSTADLVKERSQLEEKKSSAAATAEDIKRLEEVNEKIKAVSAIELTPAEVKELADSTQKISAAQEALKAISAEILSLEGSVEKLKPQAKVAEQVLDKLERADAFSVFGRFESSTRADNSRPSVDLGKVFSTGVASQHLSQGLGDYYKSLGISACYDAVAKLSEKITDAAILQKLLGDCRPSSVLNVKNP